MSDPEEKEVKEENEFLKAWMIRPCWVYKDEYDECTCWKARFHQYFIHGHKIDCSSWKEDYKQCQIWENNKSVDAYNALIESETLRRRKRLAGHYGNTVWKKRNKPPENWDAPLPEWMQERIKKSLLENVKPDDLKKGSGEYCTIM